MNGILQMMRFFEGMDSLENVKMMNSLGNGYFHSIKYTMLLLLFELSPY